MSTVMIPSQWLAVGAEDKVFLSIFAAAFLLLLLQSKSGPSKHETAHLRELNSIPQAKLNRGNAARPFSKSRNICDINNDPTAIVFWGSQGGTAEALASRYASELSSRFSLRATVEDLADYDHVHIPALPSYVLIVFVLATYGEGDPTDNALSLLADLQALSGENSRLTNVRYALFGLGNKKYRHYNKVALDVDQLLLDMGAFRLGDLGLGDDSRGTTEEDFISWRTSTDTAIAKEFGLQQKPVSYIPRIELRPLPNLADTAPGVYQGEPSVSNHDSSQISSSRVASKLFVLPIENAYQLISGHSDEGRHCLHVEFDLSKLHSAHYETGDYLQIWPMNPEDEVKSLLTVLSMWEGRKKVIKIAPLQGLQSRGTFPSPTTLEVLFRHCLEICGPVSREFMSGLMQFISDEDPRNRFQEIVNDRDAFRARVTLRHLTLATALKEIMGDQVASLQVPVSYILDNFKRLLPRSYSISSSALADPRKLAVTALAVNNTTTGFKGVTSNYLLQLQRIYSSENPAQTQKLICLPYSTEGPRGILKGRNVFAQIRRSEFKLPSNPATPIVMIGSGTGVAPFRAFVQERMKLKLQGTTVGKTVLVVGHRSPDEDFYYKELWQRAQECLGDDFELCCVFSRAGQRQYVQDVLKTKPGLIFDILNSEKAGTMYLCGSSAMARGVKDSLKELLTQTQGTGPSGAEVMADEWIAELQSARRLQEDSWG